MNRALTITLVLVLLIVTGLIFFLSEAYPAVLINWRPISMDSFNKESAAAAHYYRNLSEVYGENFSVSADSAEFQREIQRAVLDKIIEDRVVENALGTWFKESELEKIVAKKIGDAMEGAGDGIRDKVAELYGIQLSDFRREILEPQARLEVLEGRFIIENNASSTFKGWLNSLKKEADVTVLIPGFYWDGDKVVISE